MRKTLILTINDTNILKYTTAEVLKKEKKIKQ